MKNVCTLQKRYLKSAYHGNNILFSVPRQAEKRKGTAGVPFQAAPGLLSAEGFAVGALIHGGIALMGAHQNLFQGAVVLALAVVGALAHSAFHTFVGMTVHILSPPFPWFDLSMNPCEKNMRGRFLPGIFLFLGSNGDLTSSSVIGQIVVWRGGHCRDGACSIRLRQQRQWEVCFVKMLGEFLLSYHFSYG